MEKEFNHPQLKDARFHLDPSTNLPYLIIEDVISKNDNGIIRVLKINRVKQKNAFDDWLYLALVDALNECILDEKVLVVVLTGTGEYFTAGADLYSSKNSGITPTKTVIESPVCIFMRSFIRFPKPIIGVVNGPAIGIGGTILPHFDLVFAADTTYIWTPFSRIALAPEFCSSVTFPRILGTSVANELLLLSKKLDVNRAHQLGLVSGIFPQKQVLEKTLVEIQNGLIYPLLERTFPLFKNMLKKWDQQELDKICIEELEKIKERERNGDVSAAITQFKQKSSKTSTDKKSLL